MPINIPNIDTSLLEKRLKQQKGMQLMSIFIINEVTVY